MNIALFGGSFNPIHKGHMKLIKAISENYNIDKFILMPTAVSPHKSNNEMVSDFHRFNMCKLACDRIDSIEVSDWEINRKEKSYTYLTVNYLKTIYPDDNLYLVIGADMFMCFETWKNFKEILNNVSLITVPRDDIGYNQMTVYGETLKEYGARYHILKESVMDVSSSEIREKIRNKISVSNLLDAKVLEYIENNQLFR